MRVEVQYGDGKQCVELPEENVGEIIHPKDLPPLNENEILGAAFKKPLGSQTLEEFVKGAKDIIVVVNDATRPTPTGRILEPMMPQLQEKQVSYIIATGMHRAPTEDEFKFIFGLLYEKVRDHLHVHDSKASEMEFIGTSRNGTRLMLNRKVMEVLPARGRSVRDDRAEPQACPGTGRSGTQAEREPGP
jgi:nickel-dependent lactate racemase